MIDQTNTPRTLAEIQKIWREGKHSRTPSHEYVKSGKVAIIGQKRGRSRPNGDWALSATLMKTALAALEAGRVSEAFVVQLEDDVILRFLDVRQIAKNIGAVEPFEGKLGPYYWLNEKFELATGVVTTVSDDEAF